MSASNPLLLDFANCIETRRLLLRAPQADDGRFINEAFHESLDELKPWMPWAQTAPSLEESELYVRQNCAKWIDRTELLFLGFHGDRFVLDASLFNIDWNIPNFEIGYWLRTSACGQGLMTEAVVALTDFAFNTLNAKRVQLRCDSNNTRSCRVAERAGFALEGTRKNDSRWSDGTLRATLVFAITRADASPGGLWAS